MTEIKTIDGRTIHTKMDIGVIENNLASIGMIMVLDEKKMERNIVTLKSIVSARELLYDNRKEKE